MLKVLIIEDDPMVAKINKEYIESINGFTVIGTTCIKKDIIKIIKEKGCDLITLDIGLPQINGIDLLRKIREIDAFIDIIMVTASQETPNIEEALKLGAIDYLIKPFEFNRLKESLENYRKRKKLMQQKTLNQNVIDNILLKNSTEPETVLEKGISKRTLKLIIDFFNKNNDYFSAQEIASSLKLSTVTVRRYLEYLVKSKEAEIKIEYKKQGRPKHLYKLI